MVPENPLCSRSNLIGKSDTVVDITLDSLVIISLLGPLKKWNYCRRVWGVNICLMSFKTEVWVECYI